MKGLSRGGRWPQEGQAWAAEDGEARVQLGAPLCFSVLQKRRLALEAAADPPVTSSLVLKCH